MEKGVDVRDSSHLKYQGDRRKNIEGLKARKHDREYFVGDFDVC